MADEDWIADDRTVRLLYQAILGRLASDEEVDACLQIPATQLAHAILTSDEARPRLRSLVTSLTDPPATEVIGFVYADGQASTLPVEDAPPFSVLEAIPFDALIEGQGTPRIRTIGRYARALAETLRHRGIEDVVSGLAAARRRTLIVATSTFDIGLLRAARPDLVYGVSRIATPVQTPARFDDSADWFRQQLALDLHRFGFAEVVAVMQPHRGDDHRVIEVTQWEPAGTRFYYRDSTVPVNAWLLANRIPRFEGT